MSNLSIAKAIDKLRLAQLDLKSIPLSRKHGIMIENADIKGQIDRIVDALVAINNS